MPCKALTAADFSSYQATLQTITPAFNGDGCSYVMGYVQSGAEGANVLTLFLPACQFATDRSTYQMEASTDGGSGVTNFQDVSGVGDAAFYYELAGESNIEVQHHSLVLRLTSSVCNDMGCMGPSAMPSTIALAKVVVSRF